MTSMHGYPTIISSKLVLDGSPSLAASTSVRNRSRTPGISLIKSKTIFSARRLGHWLLQAQALKGFHPQSFGDTANPGGGNLAELFGRYWFLVMESRKHKLEKVLTDLRDRPFGGQIGDVDIVNPPNCLVYLAYLD